MSRIFPEILVSAGLLLVLVAAGREPAGRSDRLTEGSETATALTIDQAPSPTQRDPDLVDPTLAARAPAAPNYYLNWWSVNGGGTTNVNGTNFDLGVSVGQAAAGFVTGTNYKMGVGYWYGAAGGACLITLSGDLNLSTTITSSDIIVLVNYVFKGGPAPMPCAANGDVNCSGTVTSSDIIVLVNYVFKGGAAPCDICTIIPSLWSCP